MADVFVSYKKEDRRLAETVVEALEAQGFSVWWDQDITPRESWDGMIQREAETAKALVVLWTPRSIASEWVRAEAAFGKSRNKLIPLTMEACELPIAFSLVQAADLTRWRGQADNPEWQRAVAWISEQCQKPVAAVAPAKAKAHARLGWIAAGVALAAVGVIATVLLLQPKPLAGAEGGEAPLQPLPEGPMGEVDAARRAFLAEPSAAECETRFNVVYAQSSEVEEASLGAVDAEMEKLAGCEISAVLLEGHADAAEADPGGVARARAEGLAGGDWFPTGTVTTASLGAEELAVKTPAGISLKQNRRVEVRIRGLPREVVREAAYKALGLTNPADRSQPFSRILFGYDRFALDIGDEITRTVLQTWRDILAENPSVKIMIVGNVGDDTTREYAIALGERRSRAIRDYMISLGADASRISTLSYGKERPAVVSGVPRVVARMANRSAYIEIDQ